MAESKVLGPEFKRKAGRKPKEKKAEPVETDDTVCVALNRPMGLNFPMADGSVVSINGNGEPLRGQEMGILTPGSYGLTIIKEEQWNYILQKYGHLKIFQNGFCFACKKKADAQEEAENRDDLRNGLEPVNVEQTATKEAVGENA
jgi:hypothetical protein